MSDRKHTEMTPRAALAELDAHSWAMHPRALGQLVDMAREGRLMEAICSEVTPTEFQWQLRDDGTLINAAGQVLDLEAARRGRPRKVRGGLVRIPLKGVLMPASGLMALFGIEDPIAAFRRNLGAALEDPEVGGIVMDIDSPGGVVDQIPELAAEVRAARDKKPITAVANTMAASAAYWIGSQASEFVITPSGNAGSIGVYATHQDHSGQAEKLGIKVTMISAGKYKTEGNPYEPLGDEARDHWQEDVDNYYDLFTQAVADGRSLALGRKVKRSEVVDGFGEGRSLTAKAAVEAGIADRIETIGGVVGRLLSRSTDAAAAAEAEAGAALLAEEAEAEAGADSEDRERERARHGFALFGS